MFWLAKRSEDPFLKRQCAAAEQNNVYKYKTSTKSVCTCDNDSFWDQRRTTKIEYISDGAAPFLRLVGEGSVPGVGFLYGIDTTMHMIKGNFSLCLCRPLHLTSGFASLQVWSVGAHCWLSTFTVENCVFCKVWKYFSDLNYFHFAKPRKSIFFWFGMTRVEKQVWITA